MGLLDRYRAFVLRHSDVLGLAETGLSALTWLLPERWGESELSLETLHTAINLLGSMHDAITRQAEGPLAPGSDLGLLLGALQQIQVLIELCAIRWERNGLLANRYDAIALLEGFKALVRVLVLHRSQARLLLHSRHDNVGSWGRSGNTLPPSGSSGEVFHAFARFRERHVWLGTLIAAGPQDKSIEVGTLGNQSEAATGQQHRQCYWWDSAVVPKGAPLDPCGSCEGGVLHEVERRFALAQEAAVRMVVVGELLHLLRPLVHALALRRWGRASWRPWLLALGMDLTSQQLSLGGVRLSQRAAATAAHSPAARNTSLALLFSLQALRWVRTEHDELARRRVQMAWVLLRDPLFGRYVQPALEAWARAASHVPLLGGLSARAVEILVGWQQYFSFACSS